ncbi:MAG: FAD-dependent oxidoreductase [Acetobacteraceae bacterium]|nr:FAD-dependent oxidoreductase [Acetobacteraceae bacterium]
MIYDLIIIGAGPAGVSAAIETRSYGLSVLVLDENAAPGGRIWQGLERRGASDQDDALALRTLAAFRDCGADMRWRATAWGLESDGSVYWSTNNLVQSAQARYVTVATGATERPLPIPGWTLPGVMTIGAAQIAWKIGGLVPDKGTWIAGQGPLLLLYAVQALRAGGNFAGILDLSDGTAPFRALRHIPKALPGAREILKGLSWRREIARAGIPWLSATNLRAEGSDRLQRLRFRAHGRECTEPADMLLLHDGVIPSVQITRALGCEHLWDAAQRCWTPLTDAWGFTTVPNVLAAGDGAGISRALAAELSGRLAALGVAHALGRIDSARREAAAAPVRAERARHLAIRPLLDSLYSPLELRLPDEAIVCRCEEVTAGEIRAAARLGCLGLNQMKAFTRSGMGPCQGRMCGAVAAEVLAEALGVRVQDIEPYRLRFPTKPVTVGELASLDQSG